MKEIICELGEKLEFEVEREVPASSSAWVDIVWYDKRFRFPKPKSTETLLRVPKLPVVAFEIEAKTATNPKHQRKYCKLRRCRSLHGHLGAWKRKFR
ncbi:MAG: hypothetical protein QXU46_02210, partial [Candidatus Bathyarchaeia archaeon]